MQRLLAILGGLILIVLAGLYWPAAQPFSASASEGRSTARQRMPAPVAISEPLVVHRPQPHPAIIAAGQLLISLYALVAQQRPAS